MGLAKGGGNWKLKLLKSSAAGLRVPRPVPGSPVRLRRTSGSFGHDDGATNVVVVVVGDDDGGGGDVLAAGGTCSE